MRFIVEPPELPLRQRASGSLRLRYEDVTQDGRLLPWAMVAALGEVFWHGAAKKSGLQAQLRGSGVMPILTHLSCESAPGPLSVTLPVTAHSRYELAHCVGEGGEVARLLLRVWLDLRAPRAHTHGAPPAGAGEVGTVGRLFAEHVFTRPFAPNDERRVLRLPAGELPEIPPERRVWHPAAELLSARASETLLASHEPFPVLFGYAHTDANQHVNSLAYPRVFYDAALRALLASHSPRNVRLCHLQLGYRKPCFAGDEMVVSLSSYREGDAVVLRGLLAPRDLNSAEQHRAHVFGCLRFELC